MYWLFWTPLIAACLHIFEEFVFPGGFSEWYKTYKPGIKKSVTWKFLFLINGGLLILCYDIAAIGAGVFGIALWLGVMTMLAANGIWHIKGVIKTKEYSPGVITGTILYIPLAVYGFIYFLSNDMISILYALAAFIIGASYQLWSILFHRLRSVAVKE